MGEYQPVVTSTDEDGSTAFSVPPQVLARWAALASERAYLGSIPQQAR